MKTRLISAAILLFSVWAGTAMADGGSYTGNWPVTAKLPPQFGNTGCLSLIDNGTVSSPHSGPVKGSGDLGGGLSGTFQVVNNLLVVNLQSGSDSGEVVYISFIARARNGNIGNGVFNEPGYLASAPLTFGKKGGC